MLQNSSIIWPRSWRESTHTDQAKSGAQRDRLGLAPFLAAGQNGQFEIVLVDDLSRLARDSYLMLSVLAELHFAGVRVVSVADRLDSNDEESTLGIQIRGIFNELQLRDLKKKTLCGQKQRGFSVGERTNGYKSIPDGADLVSLPRTTPPFAKEFGRINAGKPGVKELLDAVGKLELP